MTKKQNNECINSELQMMSSALDVISNKMSSIPNEELIKFECVCIQLDIIDGILRMAYTPNREL